MKQLEKSLFSSIVAHTPLISIDLLVQNSAGYVLLGLRNNKPAHGMWFVPGGRIFKDESIPNAFSRLTHTELGLSIPINRSEFLGVYEHFYPDNFLDDRFSTHYVVLGYQLTLELELDRLPQEQHQSYRWWDVNELLASESVHEHSKWYLMSH